MVVMIRPILIMTRQEFDLGPLRDMTWLQLDGGFLYGAHEVADDDVDKDDDDDDDNHDYDDHDDDDDDDDDAAVP